MWIFRHFGAVVGLCLSCSGTPDPPPGVETMSSILEEMIRHNQILSQADSLEKKRRVLFEKYGTNEREIRAWIDAMRENVARGQELAKRVAEAMDKPKSKPPFRGKRKPSNGSR